MLLTVSRLSFWKRVDRSIRLLAELAARGSSARLVIVGVGPEESRLRELAVALGIMDRVTFVGGVPRDQLASYYTSADLLLSLYDYSNLGNPAIEAMLLGVPVVAYDVGGTRDLVIDGVNGILVAEPDNASALADTVGALLDEPESGASAWCGGGNLGSRKPLDMGRAHDGRAWRTRPAHGDPETREHGWAQVG